MKGKRRLIARLDANASALARVERELSKTERVTDGGATGGNVNLVPELPPLSSRESSWPVRDRRVTVFPCCTVGGKVIEGKDDARDSDGTFSQPCELSSPEPEAVRRFVPSALFFAFGESTCYKIR